MTLFRFTVLSLLFTLNIIITSSVSAQQNVKIGAYYFDGWRSLKSVHLTKALKSTYNNRESKWGWVTSTQDIVDKQILLAKSSGLSFFSFCYFHSDSVESPLNNALKFYLSSNVRDSLDFSLMISNHSGFEVGPKNWVDFTKQVIEILKYKSYLKVNGEVLLTFFSMESLIHNFGTAEAVNDALTQLRNAATSKGIKGISFACCISPDIKKIKFAEACGFDIFTGYNYHDVGLHNKIGQVPIDNMRIIERRIWNSFKNLTKTKYIPAVTLNWDPRPWESKNPRYAKGPIFKGYSKNSVYRSVESCITWLNTNSTNTTLEKIALLYAWNEYGEGAYLTPSSNGDLFLDGVKAAIKKN
jgi:hypothetical protein